MLASGQSYAKKIKKEGKHCNFAVLPYCTILFFFFLSNEKFDTKRRWFWKNYKKCTQVPLFFIYVQHLYDTDLYKKKLFVVNILIVIMVYLMFFSLFFCVFFHFEFVFFSIFFLFLLFLIIYFDDNFHVLRYEKKVGND